MKIDTNLWIGPVSKAWDSKYMKKHGITHVLCCAREFCDPPAYFNKAQDKTNWCYLPIEVDIADSKTKAHFLKGAAKLDKWLKAGKPVIVHSWGGISRSAAVVLTYYMVHKGLTYDDAFNKLKSRYPKLHPHPAYVKILKSISSKTQTRKATGKSRGIKRGTRKLQ